jgi:hypothetical protein
VLTTDDFLFSIGKFPECVWFQLVLGDVYINIFPSSAEIAVDQPILVSSHKLTLNMVAADGKDAKTVFQRLSYNGSTSVVLCKLKHFLLAQGRIAKD